MIDCTPDLRPVRDQGRRGTCVAFATTTAHEHTRAVRRGPLSDDLSIELLFWRCKQLDGNHNDGTSFASARDALADPGQCDEAHWPYAPLRDPSASYTPPAAVGAAAKGRATMTPIATDMAAVQTVLRAGRPVVAGLQLWDGFYDCDSATLEEPVNDIDPTALHAVVLAGLDEEKQSLMIRNSWGPAWGLQGYAWLPVAALELVLLEAWIVDDDIDPG